jgi:hypothetical protein
MTVIIDFVDYDTPSGEGERPMQSHLISHLERDLEEIKGHAAAAQSSFDWRRVRSMTENMIAWLVGSIADDRRWARSYLAKGKRIYGPHYPAPQQQHGPGSYWARQANRLTRRADDQAMIRDELRAGLRELDRA